MVAWVLNLDAEDELAAPRGEHIPSPAMRARMAALVARIEGLVLPGDVVVSDRDDARAEGQIGDAWCPTPRARERLRRAGAVVPRAPPLEVLRAVNARAFSASLGQTLAGAAYATREDDVLARLEGADGPWLLKRPLGFAGRGRRKVNARALTKADRAWIAASVRDHGGLQVEPLVTRLRDFAIHAAVGEDGALRLGAPTVQRCDENGAWLSTSLAGAEDLAREEEEGLRAEATRAARALHDAGYFGPFGVDAYRWRAEDGREHFNARSEINARYSMGWGVGMRAFRVC